MFSSKLSKLVVGRSLTTGRVVRFAATAAIGSKEHIDGLVKSGKKVIVFMKGTPDAPRCGFSNAVVQILKMHGVDQFDAYNVLEDENLRQGIKDYTNWPTVPQVFINGEFIGGCDIMIELHQKGELIEELKKAGITSALVGGNTEKA
jgi:monothiol glutaredoxin